MSFLFGKSKKSQPNALPAATRDITSSHGPESRIPTANGIATRTPDLVDKRLQQQPAPSSSLESMRDASMLPGPEPVKAIRQRSESDLGVSRTAATESPYPWSTRRLNFTSQLSPFPRYGAAANSASNKEGQVYLMGGLVDSQTVKGDLWMIEVGNGSMACYPINTTSEGPGPRVGHSSLLVGNAFIVFGGDTKLEEGDVLDDTLYLLNISTKQWSRASPAGPRPAGRYGHTLNILGSKIFIFGGQVEGYFFNDLVAFDLNSLQTPGNRWEVMIPNGGNGGPVPKPRTNHSVITWQDKLYLFGGTDGTAWFNDVWVYDSRSNSWTELDCIGYIPAPREGHAASIVNDTMYIFGGRLQDGTDLGDLAAFRISSRRWYMFQNMGSSPSARSGHSMTAVGKHIVVVAGEPSSAPRDATELSWAYVLDTTKIRYPQSETGAVQTGPAPNGVLQTGPGGQLPLRNFGGDQSRIPQKSGGPVTGPNVFANRGLENGQNNAMSGQQAQSRLPRNAGTSGPPPPQAAPQPRGPPAPISGQNGSRSRTPTTNAAASPDGSKLAYDRSRDPAYERKDTMSPDARDPPGSRATSPQELDAGPRSAPIVAAGGVGAGAAATAAVLAAQSRPGASSRSDSRVQRQQESIDSTVTTTPRPSEDLTRSSTRDTAPIDSGLGSSPSLGQHNDALVKEVEAARSRNAWLASELALARKSGYNTSASAHPLLDQHAADAFGEDDRPLIEALLEMKAELNRVQGSIETQAEQTAARISEIEKQRDAAVSEAVYARAKLAAHGGSQAGTPQPDARGNSTPDLERNHDMGKRLASMLTAHNELNTRLESITNELESERRARNLAEDTAGASQKRAAELDTYKQHTALELESLRAELYEAKRLARDESTNCAEALAALRMHELDKNDIASKHTRIVAETKHHTAIMQTLREAVTASTEKADLLERRIVEERELRESSDKKHSQLRAEHEERLSELSSTQRKLKDAEELAQKHAEEARTHKAAVLSGLDRVSSRDLSGDDRATDERVKALQEQLNVANDMVKKHKSFADDGADRVRRAEERIAGLETYQEQTARESLALRKQLQSAMKEVQAAQSERNGMQQRLERNMLEGNALEVQLRTLKNLLEERGVSTADVRRSRILDSPNSRYGTPEMGRVRDLERQLDDSLKAHDEIRTTFEQREQEMEEKLASYETDRDGAVKYVHGLEKLLAKMKQELQRAKATNVELEKGIQAQKAGGDGQASDWEAERDALRNDMNEQRKSIKTTVAALEAQIATLKTTVSQAEKDRDAIRQDAAEAQQAHEARIVTLTGRATADLEALRHENAVLEERAADAEKRAQLFLDQFESSVDTYRRQSRLEKEAPTTNGISRHAHKQSIGGESMYSNMTDTTEPEDETDHSGNVTPSAHSFPTAGFAGNVISNDKHTRDRSSTALDSLATELDALRSHWEETSKKSYRLSDRFDFERTGPASDTPVIGANSTSGGFMGPAGANHSTQTAGLAASPEAGSVSSPLLGNWRKKMDLSAGDSAGGAAGGGTVGGTGEDWGRKENQRPGAGATAAATANGDMGGQR